MTVELQQRFIRQSLFFVDEKINDEENNYQQNDADNKNSYKKFLKRLSFENLPILCPALSPRDSENPSGRIFGMISITFDPNSSPKSSSDAAHE